MILYKAEKSANSLINMPRIHSSEKWHSILASFLSFSNPSIDLLSGLRRAVAKKAFAGRYFVGATKYPAHGGLLGKGVRVLMSKSLTLETYQPAFDHYGSLGLLLSFLLFLSGG